MKIWKNWWRNRKEPAQLTVLTLITHLLRTRFQARFLRPLKIHKDKTLLAWDKSLKLQATDQSVQALEEVIMIPPEELMVVRMWLDSKRRSLNLTSVNSLSTQRQVHHKALKEDIQRAHLNIHHIITITIEW